MRPVELAGILTILMSLASMETPDIKAQQCFEVNGVRTCLPNLPIYPTIEAPVEEPVLQPIPTQAPRVGERDYDGAMIVSVGGPVATTQRVVTRQATGPTTLRCPHCGRLRAPRVQTTWRFFIRRW